MKITIITGAFGCIPPFAIGAVEKLWYQIGEEWKNEGYEVCFVSKLPNETEGLPQENIYIKGYWRSGSILKDTLWYELIYSIRAMKMAPKSDVVILSIIWGPLLFPFFRRKMGKSIFNVARFPKAFYGLFRWVDSLSCVSTAVYDVLVQRFPYLKSKAYVVPNPIDTSIYTSQTLTHVYSKTPTIIFMGRVHREKGLHTLVRAMTILHTNYDLKLDIIGPTSIEKGGSGDAYVEELNQLAIGWKINWIGPIYDAQELASRVNAGHIFCYPSEAEHGETFGVSPLEAMGLGVVPVVSALGCFRDFIENGKNGFIYDHRASDAVEQLAACLEKLILDERMYKEYSAMAIETAKQFSIKKIADMYIKVFDKIKS